MKEASGWRHNVMSLEEWDHTLLSLATRYCPERCPKNQVAGPHGRRGTQATQWQDVQGPGGPRRGAWKGRAETWRRMESWESLTQCEVAGQSPRLSAKLWSPCEVVFWRPCEKLQFQEAWTKCEVVISGDPMQSCWPETWQEAVVQRAGAKLWPGDLARSFEPETQREIAGQRQSANQGSGDGQIELGM